jgi:VWFA-related protein
MRLPVTIAVLLLSLAAQSTARGQAPAKSPQTITANATAILVDVVVRDKNGRPVTDLTAQDFVVAEDGVPQRIDSFTRVTNGGGIGVNVAWRTPDRTIAVTPATAGGATEPAGPASEVEDGTTAIVFGHLSADSLRLAQRATLGYIPMNGESSVRVGVFSADPNMRVLQRYTTDRAQVRQAVARAIPSSSSLQEQSAERLDDLITRRRSLDNADAGSTVASAGGGAGGGGGVARTGAEIGQRETERRLVQTELNMIRSFEAIDRDHRGYDIAIGLRAVVDTLSNYPGRKTIVFFSEGLPVSPSLAANLDTLIDAANRASITTYAVDAHGLRARSTNEHVRKELTVFSEERMQQNATGVTRSEQPLTMSFERVEDLMQLDSRAGLARLSEDTGGFLIDGSNDLSAAFKRIDEDHQFHYLLTYAPTNTAFDGKFRAIRVDVRRPGTVAFARKGYRALGAPRRSDADTYDLPALTLLDRTPPPNAFPVQAAGFSFPDAARPGLTPLLVRVDTSVLRFDIDERPSTYSAQAVIAVRLRDADGREVQKLSQQYLVAGDARDVAAAKRGDIIFYREADLIPGVYTMEAIVYDAVAQSGSVRVATLTVPPVTPTAFRLSSLVVVSRAEETRGMADDAPSNAPFYLGRTLLYPNLGEPLRKSLTSDLSFYFTLYGEVSATTVTAVLMQHGKALAEAPVQLPPAASSRVQHVGKLPIAALPNGTYELSIRVTDGQRTVSRSAFFTVAN